MSYVLNPLQLSWDLVVERFGQIVAFQYLLVRRILVFPSELTTASNKDMADTLSGNPLEVNVYPVVGLPSVSFLIPTYNAGRYLDRCLQSISVQDYPREKVETLVIDGGSADNTIQVSRKYSVREVRNPWRLAESGLEIGVHESKGEVIVVLAADNALPDSRWLTSMVRPLVENEDVIAAFPFPQAGPDDPPMNRYYCLVKTDPLTFFVFDSFGNRLQNYPAVLKGRGYDVFLFPKDNPPLVALAQGFVLRKSYAPNSIAADDVAPFCELVMAGSKFALVKETGILHLHLDGLRSFVKKYVYRAKARLVRPSVNRPSLMNAHRRLRIRIWLLYSLSLVWPTTDAIRGYKREPDRAWFYHAVACYLLTLINIVVGASDLRRTLKHMRS